MSSSWVSSSSRRAHLTYILDEGNIPEEIEFDAADFEGFDDRYRNLPIEAISIRRLALMKLFQQG
jgi:hypothetical protein